MEQEHGCGFDRHDYRYAETAGVIFCSWCGDTKSLSDISSLAKRMCELEKKLDQYRPLEQQRKLDEAMFKKQMDFATDLGSRLGKAQLVRTQMPDKFAKNPVVITSDDDILAEEEGGEKEKEEKEITMIDC